ncbi:MAG: hypothetical protein J1F40_08850 [Prevotellaceae bacterium]|nr:hypothetical protein [Prevotellaceae bacterium]
MRYICKSLYLSGVRADRGGGVGQGREWLRAEGEERRRRGERQVHIYVIYITEKNNGKEWRDDEHHPLRP